MQNTPFLALLRPISALKTKIAPPSGIGNDNWSSIRCDFEQNNWVSAWLKTFFPFLFFLRSRKFGQKKRPNFDGYLFFAGDHQYLGTKTNSIRSKTDKSLGQDRLMLLPASKIPPTLQIPGYTPE